MRFGLERGSAVTNVPPSHIRQYMPADASRYSTKSVPSILVVGYPATCLQLFNTAALSA